MSLPHNHQPRIGQKFEYCGAVIEPCKTRDVWMIMCTHIHARSTMWFYINGKPINHHTGPNIRGVIEYVSFSVGGEFYQAPKLTAK